MPPGDVCGVTPGNSCLNAAFIFKPIAFFFLVGPPPPFKLGSPMDSLHKEFWLSAAVF